MGPLSHKESRRNSERKAFTLIEIVVALTIVSVIAAVAIPTLKGLNRDEQTAAPLRSLARMVQDVRDRAMHERRPYQIVFEREGAHACEFSFPIEKREEFLNHLDELRTPPKDQEIDRQGAVQTEVVHEEMTTGAAASAASGKPAPEAAPDRPVFEMPWTQSIPFPPKAECSVLLWGDGEWDVLDGERVRRWVFQRTGVASPARLRLRVGETEMETSFDTLTGEVRRERMSTRPSQP